jgi:hypothetical protein
MKNQKDQQIDYPQKSLIYEKKVGRRSCSVISCGPNDLLVISFLCFFGFRFVQRLQKNARFCGRGKSPSFFVISRRWKKMQTLGYPEEPA